MLANGRLQASDQLARLVGEGPYPDVGEHSLKVSARRGGWRGNDRGV